MKKSQAFAAYRTEVINDAQNQIVTTLVPQYNAEVEDIRRTTETIRVERGEALADHHKRARITDLKVRQQEFIDSLNKEVTTLLIKRVQDYKGTVTEKEIEGGRKVLEASFDDNSVARVPKSLWVDYNQFRRV